MWRVKKRVTVTQIYFHFCFKLAFRKIKRKDSKSAVERLAIVLFCGDPRSESWVGREYIDWFHSWSFTLSKQKYVYELKTDPRLLVSKFFSIHRSFLITPISFSHGRVDIGDFFFAESCSRIFLWPKTCVQKWNCLFK